MIVSRITVQSPSMITPSVFATSVEIASQLKTYSGTKFCIIPTEKFSPSLDIERSGNKLKVTALPRANTKKVFDHKITSSGARKIPHGYTFHFNIEGEVLGVTQGHSRKLSFDETKDLVVRSGLPMVDHIIIGSKQEFIGTLLKHLLTETCTTFDNVLRTGFYIGDNPLRHTNKISIAGAIAVVFSPEAVVRIKGIYNHATAYTETVFWFELKQTSPTLYDILKEEELKSTFIDGLVKCL